MAIEYKSQKATDAVKELCTIALQNMKRDKSNQSRVMIRRMIEFISKVVDGSFDNDDQATRSLDVGIFRQDYYHEWPSDETKAKQKARNKQKNALMSQRKRQLGKA